MECREPGLVRDEDLLAYLAGERVRPLVEQHVANCAHCTQRLADLRRLDFLLLSKLYRWDCPPNQVLGEYQLGMLDRETTLAVSLHLRACVACMRRAPSETSCQIAAQKAPIARRMAATPRNPDASP
jgi:hypothetical protein